MSVFRITVNEPDPDVPGTGAFTTGGSGNISGLGVGVLISAVIVGAVVVMAVLKKRSRYSYDGRKKGFSLSSRGKKITGLFSILLLTTALVVPLVSNGSNPEPVFADEGDTGLTINAFDAIFSLQKIEGGVQYGTFGGTVSVVSSTTAGYTLSMYASSADLLPTDSSIQTKFSGLTGAALTSLGDNTWGASIADDPAGQNNDWYAVPTTKETALVLADKSTNTPASDGTKVTFGVAIGPDMEVGTYQTTITYVATAKVTTP